MHRTKIWCALVTVLAMTAGCGGLTAKSFCEKYTSDVLSKFGSCLGAPADAEPEVSAFLHFDPGVECSQMETAIAKNRMKFDAGKAQSCLDYLEGLSCGDLMTGGPGPCTDAVAGQGGAGDTCYSNYDCTASSFCTANAGTCPGTCLAYTAKGGDCSGGQAPCVSGTYCDGQTCQADPAKGASCDTSKYASCGSSLYCKPSGQGTSGTCQPYESAGGTCPSGNECEFGLWCSSGTCQKIPTVGNSCTSATGCGELTWCDSGKCAEFPKQGGACGTIGQSQVGCLGSYCKVTNAQTGAGTCTAFVPDGQTCDASDAGGGGGCGLTSVCANNGDCAPHPVTYCPEKP